MDFLDCCGSGLFLATEKPRDLLPPEPLKLLHGVAAQMPSEAVVRLHLKLLSLLQGTVRLDSKTIPPIDLLTWPAKLRIAMEDDLLLRAQQPHEGAASAGDALTDKVAVGHLGRHTRLPGVELALSQVHRDIQQAGALGAAHLLR